MVAVQDEDAGKPRSRVTNPVGVGHIWRRWRWLLDPGLTPIVLTLSSSTPPCLGDYSIPPLDVPRRLDLNSSVRFAHHDFAIHSAAMPYQLCLY
ncbi:hypothetical protein NMY22_g9795 [Coprinellus aureogranulatus]|nr:hypothetical protein NMY22_g9795 [Coprinellus aureogranulatus]